MSPDHDSRDVDDDQGEVIFVCSSDLSSRPHCKFLEQRIRKGVRGQAATGLDEVLESFPSLKLLRRVRNFCDTVCVHQDPIARNETNGDICVYFTRTKSQQQAILLEFKNRPFCRSPKQQLISPTACVIRIAMLATMVSTEDDRLTTIAISALACILQDVLHEGLGHGMTAWMGGAHIMTMSTVVLQSDVGTRWVSANGTLVNLVFGALFWLLLLRPERCRPATRYFLVLAMAGNLFTGTGYFLFSGILNFGDWAAVIRGLQPPWMWRMGLVVLGAASYYASMMLVATSLKPFQTTDNRSRLRVLCWTPYFTDGILAGLGGLLNPLGLFYVIASALPSTLGANASLLGLPAIIRGRGGSSEGQVAPLERSVVWIATAAVASLLFIFVLGRGITWSR